MSREYLACPRCGIRRQVKPERDPGVCLDCRLVEGDLAGMHGTERGYRQHLYERSVPCDPCRAYVAAEQAARRRRRGVPVLQRARCGTQSGWNRHMRNGEAACDPCRNAQAEYMREYRARRAA